MSSHPPPPPIPPIGRGRIDGGGQLGLRRAHSIAGATRKTLQGPQARPR